MGWLLRSPEALALGCAFFFALGLLIVRAALPFSTPLTSNFMVTFMNLLLAWSGVALWSGLPAQWSWAGAFWFAMVGIAGQGLARSLNYIGIGLSGAARSNTIASISPLFSALLAVLLLHERPGLAVIGGTFAIVAGVILLSRERTPGGGPMTWRHLAVPLLAASLFSVTPIFRKLGLGHMDAPLLALAVASTFGTPMLLLTSHLGMGGRIHLHHRAVAWGALAGALNFTAGLAFWVALSLGEVTVVVPLTRAGPLLVVLLGHLFLRELERVTWPVVGGTVAIVAGALLITALG
ncbi:MAG: DMT family transporter [Nitrospinota bacterium]